MVCFQLYFGCIYYPIHEVSVLWKLFPFCAYLYQAKQVCFVAHQWARSASGPKPKSNRLVLLTRPTRPSFVIYPQLFEISFLAVYLNIEGSLKFHIRIWIFTKMSIHPCHTPNLSNFCLNLSMTFWDMLFRQTGVKWEFNGGNKYGSEGGALAEGWLSTFLKMYFFFFVRCHLNRGIAW